MYVFFPLLHVNYFLLTFHPISNWNSVLSRSAIYGLAKPIWLSNEMKKLIIMYITASNNDGKAAIVISVGRAVS